MGGEEGNVCAMNVAATDFLLGVVYNFRLDDWSIRDVCTEYLLNLVTAVSMLHLVLSSA